MSFWEREPIIAGKGGETVPHRREGSWNTPIGVQVSSHVRSILEYGSIIWSDAAKSHIVRLERVQHKFLT